MADELVGDVWVGSEIGFLKAVDLKKDSFKNVGGLRSQSDGQKNEICAMCWANTEESQILLGLQNGLVKTYDLHQNTVIIERDCSAGEGDFKGLFCNESSFVTCIESGLLQIWKKDKPPTDIKVGSHISKMQHNPKNLHQVGTGGRENDLKIWDLNRPGQATFRAKNVRNDSLDLHVPVWIRDLGFLPSASSSPKVVTATGYHQLRLYDTAAQKRPVLTVEFDDCPISAVAIPEKEHLVVIGNTAGTMATLDMRQGQVVGHFKGFAGGIRCIECSERQNLVAACGLDRFVRVYDLSSRTMQHKVYLKSRLNCLLLPSQERKTKGLASGAENAEVLNEFEEKTRKRTERENGDDDDDALWANMEVIATEHKRQKKTSGEKTEKKLES